MTLDEVQLELAGLCNATCSYCTWRERTIGKQLMDGDLALSVLAQAKEMGVSRVHYHGLGEPLLHPRLLEILARGEELGFSHQLISTNCFNLREGFIGAGLRTLTNLKIVLSIHWVLQEKFLARCVENAKAYLASAPLNKKIYVQMICHESASKHFQEFYETFLPLVERIPNAVLWLKQPQTWPLDATPQVGFIPDVQHPRVEIDKMATPYSLAFGCEMPLRFLMVMADGSCAPCCVGTVSWGLGKLPEQTLREVWESARMADVRRLWASADDSILCGPCKKRTDCRT